MSNKIRHFTLMNQRGIDESIYNLVLYNEDISKFDKDLRNCTFDANIFLGLLNYLYDLGYIIYGNWEIVFNSGSIIKLKGKDKIGNYKILTIEERNINE